MPVRALPWIIRAGWALLPFVVGDVDVAVAETVVLWVAWACVLVATLVPHPFSLTTIRIATPAAVVGAVAGRSVGAAAVAAVVSAVALLPETAMAYVNGPAYPNERRFLLRVPGPLFFGPLQLGWLLVVGVPVAAVRLASAGRWVPAVAVAAIGAVPAGIASRALHGLARRWVVFVPAGLVLHDGSTLADPVLFQRRVIDSLRPAPTGTDALDLTARALGIALELDLREKVPMTLLRSRRESEEGASARLLFTPTRPGAVLAEAEARRIPIGR